MITARTRTRIFGALLVLTIATVKTVSAVYYVNGHSFAQPVDTEAGRVVVAGQADAYLARVPLEFPQQHFWLMKLDDGSFVALYAYPPGYFGHEPAHVQKCGIEWQPERTVIDVLNRRGLPVPPGQEPELYSPEVNGIWLEPCGGTQWDDQGRYIIGPAGRDLDRFPVSVAEDGTVRVDTRTLQCAGQPCERAPGSRWP